MLGGETVSAPLAGQLVRTLAYAAALAMLLPLAGPLLDHHFAERHPGHTHVYLGQKVPGHLHSYEALHSHHHHDHGAQPETNGIVYFSPMDGITSGPADLAEPAQRQVVIFSGANANVLSPRARPETAPAGNIISPPKRPPRA